MDPSGASGTGGAYGVAAEPVNWQGSRHGSSADNLRPQQGYPSYTGSVVRPLDRQDLAPRVIPATQVIVGAGVSQEASPGPRARVMGYELEVSPQRPAGSHGNPQYMTRRDFEDGLQEERVRLQRHVQEVQVLQSTRLEQFVRDTVAKALQSEATSEQLAQFKAATDEHLAHFKAELVDLRMALEDARREHQALRMEVQERFLETARQHEDGEQARKSMMLALKQMEAAMDELRHKVAEGFKGSLTQQLQLKGALERQQAQLLESRAEPIVSSRSADQMRRLEADSMRLQEELQDIRLDCERQRLELQGLVQRDQQLALQQEQQEQVNRRQLEAAKTEQNLTIEAVRSQHDLALKAIAAQSDQHKDLQQAQDRLREQLSEGFADGQAKLARMQVSFEEKSQEVWKRAEAERAQLQVQCDELARFRSEVQVENEDTRSQLLGLSEEVQNNFHSLTAASTEHERSHLELKAWVERSLLEHQEARKELHAASEAATTRLETELAEMDRRVAEGFQGADKKVEDLAAEQQDQASLLAELQSLETLVVKHLGSLKEERNQEAVRYNEEVVELHRRCEELARSQAEHGSRADLLATLDKLGELTALVLAERRERLRSHEELEEWRHRSFGAVSQAVSEVKEAAEAVVAGRCLLARDSAALARDAKEAGARQMKSLGQIKEIVEAERQERLLSTEAADARELQQWFRQLGMAP